MKLPEGWEPKRLRDLATIRYGKGLPEKQRRGGPIPVYGANGIVGFHDVPLTSGPAIIIGRKGSAGAVNWSDTDCWPIDTTFFISEFSSDIKPKFLYFFLKSQRIEHLQKSAAIPGLSRDALYEVVVRVPPLSEQCRIVARLEALLGEVRAMRAEIRAMREDLERLMEAVLGDIFPAIDYPRAGWMVVSLAEIISAPPQYGYTASAQSLPVGPKFLRITDIRDGYVDWDSVPYCQIAQPQLRKYRLKEGDILFARSGATTGKTYLVKSPPLSVFGSYLIRIRVRDPIVPDFIFWFCQSPQYWRQIILRGGAQPNINAQLIRDIRIPIPGSPIEQRRIVAYLEAIQEEIQAMRAILDEDERAVEELEQSILAAAFRGEV